MFRAKDHPTFARSCFSVLDISSLNTRRQQLPNTEFFLFSSTTNSRYTLFSLLVSSSPSFDFYPISHDFPACCRIERKGFFIPIFEYLVSIPYPHYFSNFWQLQQILYNGKTIFRLIFNFSPFSYLLRSRYLYRDIFFTSLRFRKGKRNKQILPFLIFLRVRKLSLASVCILVKRDKQPPPTPVQTLLAVEELVVYSKRGYTWTGSGVRGGGRGDAGWSRFVIKFAF